MNAPAVKPHEELLVGGIYEVQQKGHALEGREVLVVGHGDGHARAVPYPAGPGDEVTTFASNDGLKLVFGDLAAGRVIAQRRLFEPDVPAQLSTRKQDRVKQAMVLCAGLGTRLRPLTEKFPKPAVPFFGAPLVRYTFALLKNAGIETVVINTHHLPEVMEKVAQEEAARLSLTLKVSHEPVIQGTAGGLRDAKRHLDGGPLLLVNGDAFLSLDLAGLIDAHFDGGNAATMAVTPMPEGEPYGAVEAEADGKVRRIAGVGRKGGRLTKWHFLGVHVLSPEVLDFIPAGGEQDINRVVYPSMLEAGKTVRVCEVRPGAWADLGTPKRYLEACEDVMTGLCDFTPLGEEAPLSTLAAVTLREAGFRNRVHVDESAKVGLGAVLVRAQLGPKVNVGREAVLRRVAVLPGTEIAAGEALEQVVACEELRLDAR